MTYLGRVNVTFVKYFPKKYFPKKYFQILWKPPEIL